MTTTLTPVTLADLALVTGGAGVGASNTTDTYGAQRGRSGWQSGSAPAWPSSVTQGVGQSSQTADTYGAQR